MNPKEELVMQGLPLEVRVGLGYTLKKSDLLLCCWPGETMTFYC